MIHRLFFSPCVFLCLSLHCCVLNQHHIIHWSLRPSNFLALGRALSNAGASPNFGPYNMLNCRSQNITSFPLTAPNSDGLVVAFDFKPYSGTSSIQPIMTVRSISMAQSMVKVDYIQSNSSILIWYYDSSAGAYAFVLGTASSQQIPLGKKKAVR